MARKRSASEVDRKPSAATAQCAAALEALQASFVASGQPVQAIKCCEAACLAHSERGDALAEASGRLGLARLLLAHTHNVAVARRQLDRAVRRAPQAHITATRTA